MGRPITTLFMLMSVDGKISTGATDELDFDQDFPHIEGVREGYVNADRRKSADRCWRAFQVGRIEVGGHSAA